MPELPEVETVRRGLMQPLLGAIIERIIIRQSRLRWPIPLALTDCVPQQRILDLQRRGKYLLLITTAGTLIYHLGMSGQLRVIAADSPVKKHDHVDLVFQNHTCLRLTDPRRFGALLWTTAAPQLHPLLAHLGPEPLSATFNAAYLYSVLQRHKQNCKALIMNSKIVVGVGNIYATEALFHAGIHPTRAGNSLTKQQCMALVTAIKRVLKHAIAKGGTTLKDFIQADGKPGYFKQQLFVYGQHGHPCQRCQTLIEKLSLNQRTTAYCPTCQR